MRVSVLTPPVEPAVTWELAAKHLRLSGTGEKVYVEGLIAAATALIDGPDGWLGRCLGAQTLEARFSSLDAGSSVRLPYGPVISLVGVEYLDATGSPVQADTADFDLMGDTLVRDSGWPWEGGSVADEGVRVEYLAGYEDGIPSPISVAILLMVADLYRNRESTPEIEHSTAGALLRPYRIFR